MINYHTSRKKYSHKIKQLTFSSFFLFWLVTFLSSLQHKPKTQYTCLYTCCNLHQVLNILPLTNKTNIQQLTCRSKSLIRNQNPIKFLAQDYELLVISHLVCSSAILCENKIHTYRTAPLYKKIHIESLQLVLQNQLRHNPIPLLNLSLV